MADGNQITERRGVGCGDHAAQLLTRTPAGCGFEYCCLAVKVRFSDYSQGDAVLPQKIFGFNPGQPQHLRNLKQSESLVAVAFQRERFECAAGNVTTSSEPLGDIVGNTECDFHTSKLSMSNVPWRGAKC